MVKVSLTRDDVSYDAVKGALDLIGDEVHIPDDKPVLIKANMVSPTVELSATPVTAIRATMDFLQEKGVEKFTIVEGTAVDSDTMGGFQRYGYFSLREDYDVEFMDLNADKSVLFECLDDNLNPANIRLAKTLFDSYIVSVTRMKTHSQVIATLSVKNLAVGSIINDDRRLRSAGPSDVRLFSHEPKPLNLTLARLNKTLSPDLAVIDGVVGMQGNGPVSGFPISSDVALASTNPLAADIVGTQVMGLDWRTIGYLWYLTQLRELDVDDIEVVGEKPSENICKYQTHDDLPWQLGWWVENWKSYVDGEYLRDAD
jgi:uncharacterized protein (DUF362 family)